MAVLIDSWFLTEVHGKLFTFTKNAPFSPSKGPGYEATIHYKRSYTRHPDYPTQTISMVDTNYNNGRLYLVISLPSTEPLCRLKVSMSISPLPSIIRDAALLAIVLIQVRKNRRQIFLVQRTLIRLRSAYYKIFPEWKFLPYPPAPAARSFLF